MYDTYAYSPFEHIDRNMVMRNSGFDDDWTLLLFVGVFFLISSYLKACVRSLLTECDIMFVDEYPPKLRIPVA